jgi:lipopolysaccharide export system protein LptA
LAAAILLAGALPLFGDTFSFKADRMTGGKALGKEMTVLTGSAVVFSDDLVLRADRIELQGEDNRYIDCSGSVQGTDEKKGIHFTTQRLRYDRQTKVARLEGDSVLEDKENSVVAKARFIEYDDPTGKTVLQIMVRIFKDNLVCRSEYALYRRKEKILDLSGFPVVYKDGDEFRADRMRVDLETDDVAMEGGVTGVLKETAKKEPAPPRSEALPPEEPQSGEPQPKSPQPEAPQSKELPDGRR